MPLEVERAIVDRALRAADDDALEPLIVAVWPEAYRLSFAILRDRGLAEDAAQEACAAIARALPSLKEIDAFATWSYKVIVNHALGAARRRKRTVSLEMAGSRGVFTDRSDALDLYNALASLTALQRGLILLHYYAGLNSREIAASTSLPASTIRFHLMQARRALREALSATTGARTPNEVLSDAR